MAEFTPINTQEEFDAAVTARYGDIGGLQNQVSTLTETCNGHQRRIDELTNENNSYRLNALRHQIAAEKGIPYAMAGRLTGTTEEEIRADADVVASYLAPTGSRSPRVNHEHAKPGNGSGNTTDAAFEAMVAAMEGE